MKKLADDDGVDCTNEQLWNMEAWTQKLPNDVEWQQKQSHNSGK